MQLHATLRHATRRHFVSRHATVRYATPRYATLRYATLRYAMPGHLTSCHACMHVCMCACKRTHVHACTHPYNICMYACMRVCMHTHIQTSPWAQAFMRVCVHTCIHVYLQHASHAHAHASQAYMCAYVHAYQRLPPRVSCRRRVARLAFERNINKTIALGSATLSLP